MLNEERRRAILDVINRDGRALVTDLAQQFKTSQVTIRKDLEILHAHGRIATERRRNRVPVERPEPLSRLSVGLAADASSVAPDPEGKRASCRRNV